MRKAVWTVLAGLAVAGPAAASGFEFLSRVTERFADHEACIAALEGHRARELALRAPRQTNAEGQMREVQVVQSGIERPRPGRAAYNSEVVVMTGAPDAASGRLRVRATFEFINRDCEDAVMTTGGSRGFTPSVLE